MMAKPKKLAQRKPEKITRKGQREVREDAYASEKQRTRKNAQLKKLAPAARRRQIILLFLGLVAVVGGAILFVGAVSGWFGDSMAPKTTLSPEYLAEGTPVLMDLSPEEYENLISEQKSFVVFVDQAGCKTAVNLKGFLESYMKEHHFSAYRLMFSELKGTSLHNYVKYYPSIAIIDRGKVRTYLRADVDEDAEEYNSKAALAEWLDENLEF